MTDNFQLEKMSKDIEKILDILNGNGQDGALTKIALQEQKIQNLPTPRILKLYALMSGGSVGAISFIGYLIVQAFKVAGAG